MNKTDVFNHFQCSWISSSRLIS